MCPEELKKSINKKTKAIIPVHMLGVSADMKEIVKIVKKRKNSILEDNCESMEPNKNKYLCCSKVILALITVKLLPLVRAA